ncbi:hypothetical protein H6792_00270 [Candidatus Nomurabacteria bacterium]|nr:hypothetical protein [Candidatus Nomurabacteria bacterium]
MTPETNNSYERKLPKITIEDSPALHMLFGEGLVEEEWQKDLLQYLRGYYDAFGLPNIEDKPDLSELEIVFTGLSVDDEGDSWQFIQPEQDGDNARLLVSLGQIYLKLLPDLDSEEKLEWEEFTIRYNQRLMQALINGLKFYAESKKYPETIRKYQNRQRLRDWFVDIPTSGMAGLGVNDISSNNPVAI